MVGAVQKAIEATNKDQMVCPMNASKVQKFTIMPMDFAVQVSVKKKPRCFYFFKPFIFWLLGIESLSSSFTGGRLHPDFQAQAPVRGREERNRHRQHVQEQGHVRAVQQIEAN
jgi:hypothetical protein